MMLPTGIKNQGSIGGGIAMIVIGAVISAVGIFVTLVPMFPGTPKSVTIILFKFQSCCN